MSDLRIDGDRLWRSLMELAQIGATPRGGVARLALTDLDRDGRDWLVARAREAGMTVTVDRIGNVFMRRAGRKADLPPVMAGSHIDTQPTGGKFDGNYGVLAGLEVIRTLADHGVVTEAPLEIAAWTNEEGSRFVPVMMGSGVFCGAFDLDHAYAARDVEGRSVRDELTRIGYLGAEEPGRHPVACYFEAHIEQGPVLEDAAKVIGVVDAALGLRWYDAAVRGTESHAGSTPMTSRRDALACQDFLQWFDDVDAIRGNLARMLHCEAPDMAFFVSSSAAAGLSPSRTRMSATGRGIVCSMR